MQAGSYTIDILVQGFPGKSVCHGGLGWSSIVLLRGHGRTALVDVGSFGIRGPLIAHLAAHGLTPRDVTDVILTHSHYRPFGELDAVRPCAHRHRRAGTGLVGAGALGRDAGA